MRLEDYGLKFSQACCRTVSWCWNLANVKCSSICILQTDVYCVREGLKNSYLPVNGGRGQPPFRNQNRFLEKRKRCRVFWSGKICILKKIFAKYVRLELFLCFRLFWIFWYAYRKIIKFFFSKVLWGSERYGLVLFFLFFYTWPKGRRLMKKIGSQVAEYSKYGLTPPPSNYEKNIQIRTCFCRKNVLFIFISLENCIYSETLFNWSFSLEEVHQKYGEN